MTESAEALIGAIGRLVNEERVLCVCDRVCCGAKLRATACHALAHKLTLNIYCLRAAVSLRAQLHLGEATEIRLGGRVATTVARG